MRSPCCRFAPVIAAAIVAGAGRAPAQQLWNDTRTLTLVGRATERRASQLADTALVDYKARAHGYLTFLAQFGEGFTEPPRIVKADELGLEVYWRAPDLSKQRIMGRRDTLLLPTDINYHRDHFGIVQNNFKSIIRLGEGDEVRDVPHPLSAEGLAQYDYAIRDSLQIRLGPRVLDVYEVRVRPRDDRQPRAVGAVYIDRETGEVVRMAFSFTRAALRDKALEDVSVVLENGLIEGRFWLPRRQEIEIRRTGSWLDYPARGIIRGRWEICCYEVNKGIPAGYFTGPEIVMAPRAEMEQNPYPFTGRLLDSLPSDVRAVTDEDVRKVQEEARALVRAQALARGRSLALSAGRLSDIARYNRVEGLALGTGLVQRLGNGFSLGLSGRYGFSDHELKGRGALELRTGAGSSITLSAERLYRDAGEEPETSLLRNTLAAQEFGSDYTDPYDVRRVGFVATLARSGWRPSLAFGVERHGPLTVNARPASGRFEPTIPAIALRERRLTLALDRPTSLTFAGFELASRIAVTGIGGVSSVAAERGDILRPSVMVDLQRPFATQRLVSHTIVAGVLSGDSVAAQHYVFLGGPTTGPGYEFHEFVGRGGLSQRIEWRAPLPFFPVPLGRYGKAPGSITLAPFVTAVWVTRAAGFRDARNGWYPALGIGALTLFESLRFDVARGLRGGRWTFSLDVGRDFWSVL
ncbi:MAG TPA: hypothetical protein VNO75_07880 [Gemmatimonadaceae bacterium]|nr:hypothetical protein [Gemmatimonadaceae bacterium]